MPDRYEVGETEHTVEELLIKKNGNRKTANDVFEVVVAMHHDAKRRDGALAERLDKHNKEAVHFTREQVDQIFGSFEQRHEDRDDWLDRLEKDLEAVKHNCEKMHERQPRRATDAPTENWGNSVGMSVEDDEMGDLRRFWRVVKWSVAIIATPFLIAIGSHLSDVLFK